MLKLKNIYIVQYNVMLNMSNLPVTLILLNNELAGAYITFGVCHAVDVCRLQPCLLQSLLQDGQYDGTMVSGCVTWQEA